MEGEEEGGSALVKTLLPPLPGAGGDDGSGDGGGGDGDGVSCPTRSGRAWYSHGLSFLMYKILIQ